MDKTGKTNLVVGVVVAMLMILATFVVLADASVVDASVTVPSSCGISLDQSTAAFGSVGTGAESSEITRTVSNTGSTTANVTIEGSAWDGSGANTFVVGQTKYALSTGSYASKTALTGSPVQHMTDVANGGSDDSFLQMAVPSGQAADTYNQNITYTTVC